MSKTKNWINFCGVSSETIKGLLINELPPIQMTPKRVNRIEIEGRDGDIIEELGYMAYDKPVQISLTESYDIDEVISWLNNSGPIIFSNEPNKVYTATVYDTVAFERLSRFRKTRVNFHVQPFKTLLNDELDFTTNTGSFMNLTITNQGNIYSRPIIVADVGTMDWINFRINEENIRVVWQGEENESYTIILNLDNGDVSVLNSAGNKVDLYSLWYPIGGIPSFKPGENIFSLAHPAGTAADIHSFTIRNVSRWL